MNSFFSALNFKRPNSDVGETKPAETTKKPKMGTSDEYADIISQNTALKKEYVASLKAGNNDKDLALRSAQICARAIAFHIHELARVDSFIPVMEIMTRMLERDSDYLTAVTTRLCNGDKRAGETKSIEMVDQACKQFKEERQHLNIKRPRRF